MRFSPRRPLATAVERPFDANTAACPLATTWPAPSSRLSSLAHARRRAPESLPDGAILSADAVRLLVTTAVAFPHWRSSGCSFGSAQPCNGNLNCLVRVVVGAKLETPDELRVRVSEHW